MRLEARIVRFMSRSGGWHDSRAGSQSLRWSARLMGTCVEESEYSVLTLDICM